MQTVTIPAPQEFRFWATVGSHGWCELPPFGYDEDARRLTRLERLSDGSFVHLTVQEGDAGDLRVTVAGLPAAPTPAQRATIGALVARILSFEQDAAEFHALVRDDPHYGWIARIGAGRMLVSPTVWEDLAKTLLTTNTTWNMTKGMVTRLVEIGDAAPDGGHVFPMPAQVAGLTPEALNAQVRAGYRGASLHALATRIAEGQFDAEALRDPALASKDVYKQLKSIHGYGAYAAGAMMRLLGRFDELGLDSECRAAYARLYNGGQAASDRDIAAHYERFGTWRGLAVWMDVMRGYLVGALDGGEG